MRAFICNEFGPIESHKVEEVPDPEAGLQSTSAIRQDS